MLTALLKVNPLTLCKFYCFGFFSILIDALISLSCTNSNSIIILKILVELRSYIQVLYKSGLLIIHGLLLLAL